MEEIITKIKKILQEKFPDYTEEELDEMMTDHGKLLALEFAELCIQKISAEEDKISFGNYLNENRVEEAINFAEQKGVKTLEIFEELANSLLKEFFN